MGNSFYYESSLLDLDQVYTHIGPNCPGISGTVTDFFGPSHIPDSFIIVLVEVGECCIIRPLVVVSSLRRYYTFSYLS